MIATQNLKINSVSNQEIVFDGMKENLFVHYEPANLLLIFCIFACFEKDCAINEEGKLIVKLSDELKKYSFPFS